MSAASENYDEKHERMARQLRIAELEAENQRLERDLALVREQRDRLRRVLYVPRPEVFACIVDESAGLREGDEMSGVISDAADKLTEVSNKIASIDLSDEREKISEILGAAAATLGEVEASLRGFVQQMGEPSSVPQAAEVENEITEPPEGAETTPEEGAEPAEGATEVENA